MEHTRFSFNSLMVRLKVPEYSELKEAFVCFNSLMVRLKDISRHSQSHSKPSFNSLMVRLKVNDKHLSKAFHFGFNSLMVRLKEQGVTTAAMYPSHRPHLVHVCAVVLPLRA